MSLQLQNAKLPEYGETVYSDDAVETLQYIYTLADVRQDFGNNKWLYEGRLYRDDDPTSQWIEMSPELAQEVVKALKEEGKVALAEQLEECVVEAREKWGQEAVRLEIW